MSESKTVYPPWHGPFGDAELKTNNSLTGTKTPFVPKEGNKVSMYICGPTVYDSAHMGHARAYITFDILRRILEDFFGYDVTFVMNITDVDDKIILRARQNFLFAQYCEAATDVKTVVTDIRAAFAAGIASLQSKVARLQEELKTVESRYRADTEAAIKGETAKLGNMTSESATFEAKTVELKDASITEIGELLSIGKAVLAKQIDDVKGGSVTDQSIFREHSSRYEAEFTQDMVNLGVRKPDVLTRVTEYVPEIIAFVEKIIANGFGYELEGSVYFDVQAFKAASHDYGKLDPLAVNNASLAQEGEGSLASTTNTKRSPQDFALWKASKPGEPFWECPWGQGRPGWHIECSAMCSDILGESVDIHAGGEDLKFPHHDNELAQCEAHSLQQQWVNHFWHAGHLNIKGLKMSKSLKNFITIGQVLENMCSARQLRILFLLQSWDKPMNYSDSALAESATKENTLKHFFATIKRLRRGERSLTADEKWDDVDRKLHEQLETARVAVRAALCDNFDYPTVMTLLFGLINAVNSVLMTSTPKILLLCKIAKFVDKMLRIFGVMGDDDFGFQDGAGSVNKEEIVTEYLNAFAAFRSQVRALAIEAKDQKILALCDHLRDERMPELGVVLADVSGGESVWHLGDPAALMRERDAKKAADREKKLSALHKKITARVKEDTKWTDAKTAPSEIFRSNPIYADFAEDGLPGTQDGKAIAASALKKLRKTFNAQKKSHAAYQKKLTSNANFVQDLHADIASLKANFATIAGQDYDTWLGEQD
jgi:cysteinyl-tRNA synthetase